MASRADLPQIQQSSDVLFYGTGVVFAMWLHLMLWPIKAPDFDIFLLPWYEHIRNQGVVGAFAQPFGNYTPPYLYLLAATTLTHPVLPPVDAIKWLSVLGSAFLGFTIFRLLEASGARKPEAGLLAAFVLPTSVLNVALLGQCDALWAGACVLAVAAALQGRLVGMLVWVGVAVAFKAQAAFLAPFVFAVLIARRAPLQWWLIPPAVYCLFMLPAWLAGWPALDLLLIYLRQGTQGAAFVGNAANPWVWLAALDPELGLRLAPVGLATALAFAAVFVHQMRNRLNSPRTLLLAATLSALVMPAVLPSMHERYFFLADVLALALALRWREQPTILAALLTQCASLGALYSYVYNDPQAAMLGASLTLGAIILVIDLLRRERAEPPYSVVLPSHSSLS
jgi:Gpi18-like mannosyltransferase